MLIVIKRYIKSNERKQTLIVRVKIKKMIRLVEKVIEEKTGITIQENQKNKCLKK